jgi:hypothetical protein
LVVLVVAVEVLMVADQEEVMETGELVFLVFLQAVLIVVFHYFLALKVPLVLAELEQL